MVYEKDTHKYTVNHFLLSRYKQPLKPDHTDSLVRKKIYFPNS